LRQKPLNGITGLRKPSWMRSLNHIFRAYSDKLPIREIFSMQFSAGDNKNSITSGVSALVWLQKFHAFPDKMMHPPFAGNEVDGRTGQRWSRWCKSSRFAGMIPLLPLSLARIYSQRPRWLSVTMEMSVCIWYNSHFFPFEPRWGSLPGTAIASCGAWDLKEIERGQEIHCSFNSGES
jgi:hypothetical protein